MKTKFSKCVRVVKCKCDKVVVKMYCHNNEVKRLIKKSTKSKSK